MINTKHFLLGLVLGTAAIVPLASPQPAQAQTAAFKSQAQQDITKAYARIDKGILTKDPKVFVEKLAPDFEGYADNGQTFNRDQSLSLVYGSMYNQAQSGLLPLKKIKAKTKLTSFTWRGSDVIVMAQTTQVATLNYGGRINRIEFVVLSRDFWRRYSTGWLARQSVVRRSTIWLNGKKVRSIVQ